MQDAIKLMIRDGVQGAICNFGSISALVRPPFIDVYCAGTDALRFDGEHGVFRHGQPHPRQSVGCGLDGLESRTRAAAGRR